MVFGIALTGIRPGHAASSVDRFIFTPVADTYVNAGAPTTSYGTSGSIWVDSSPQEQSFLRFDLTNISGRTIQDVRLRMYQTDASSLGGRVFSVTSTTWDEGITWNTRPAIDGPQLGSFSAVSTGTWYGADLGQVSLTDGPLSLAIDSTSSNGARWASRQSMTQPQLIVEVDQVSGLALDGLSQIADSYTGSSDPTEYPNEHHMAITSGGRLLVVHGRHKSGVQLAWRDPGGGWQQATTGAVTDGLMVPNPAGTDWPASIAVARDSTGAEHAWVVFSSSTLSKPRAVQMRRLSDLDSPDGPTVGPAVTVEDVGLGNVRVDMGFESVPGGGQRGIVSYYHRAGDTAYEHVVNWFTDLDSDAPAFEARTVLYTSTSTNFTSTLVPTVNGMRLVASGSGPKLRLWTHDAAAPLGTWSKGVATVLSASTVKPSAVGLASGAVLAVGASLTSGGITVARFSANGSTVTTELQLVGYSQPSIATDGVDSWIVLIRSSDGFLVSRQYTPESGWSSTDRVEIGAEGGLNYQYPNLLRDTDGRLRLVVRGKPYVAGGQQNAVLAFQRTLEAIPPPTHTLSVSVIGSGHVASDDGKIACPPDCSASYDEGTPVTLTATADTGFSFTGWGGDCAGTDPCALTMDADKTITATF
jgi:Divergent InlB B-repeat domain